MTVVLVAVAVWLAVSFSAALLFGRVVRGRDRRG